MSPSVIALAVAAVVAIAWSRRRAAEQAEAEKVAALEEQLSAIERNEAASRGSFYDRSMEAPRPPPWW